MDRRAAQSSGFHIRLGVGIGEDFHPAHTVSMIAIRTQIGDKEMPVISLHLRNIIRLVYPDDLPWFESPATVDACGNAGANTVRFSLRLTVPPI